MNLPRMLIVSTKEGKAKEIAESEYKSTLIILHKWLFCSALFYFTYGFLTDIGAERLSEEDMTVDYLWNIDNKYYTSQVLVHAVENLSHKLSVEGVDALIVYHDPQAVRDIIGIITIRSTYVDDN